MASCRLLEPRYAERNDLGTLITAARTPRGIRIFAARGDWDGDATLGSIALDQGSSVAWAADGFLAVSERGLVRFEREGIVRRLPRGFGSHVCDPHLLDMAGSVALVYRRTSRGCIGDGSIGPVFFQRLAPSGALEGPALQLGANDPERARIASMRARWDAGRAVVHTVDETGSELDLVLGFDGREIAQVPGGGVVCARAGCVRLAGRHARDGADGMLHAEYVGAPGGFVLPLAVGDLLDAAVQGDRVLLRYGPGTSTEGEGFVASYSVVDLARRQVVSVYDARMHANVQSWVEQDASVRLLATPWGFSLVASDPIRGLFRRDIECIR